MFVEQWDDFKYLLMEKRVWLILLISSYPQLQASYSLKSWYKFWAHLSSLTLSNCVSLFYKIVWFDMIIFSSLLSASFTMPFLWTPFLIWRYAFILSISPEELCICRFLCEHFPWYLILFSVGNSLLPLSQKSRLGKETTGIHSLLTWQHSLTILFTENSTHPVMHN